MLSNNDYIINPKTNRPVKVGSRVWRDLVKEGIVSSQNYQDKKDRLKTMIKILPDNECDDIYFYELMFYTGSRVNAGTDSVVIQIFNTRKTKL